MHDTAHTLALKARRRDSKVYQSDTRAEVRSEFCGWILGSENDVEFGTVVHVLGSDSYQRSPTSSLDFLVQDGVEDWVNRFLHSQRVESFQTGQRLPGSS